MSIIESIILGILIVDILVNRRTQNRLRWFANRMAAQEFIDDNR